MPPGILRTQLSAFRNSDALKELCALLGVDRRRLGEVYNLRAAADGSVRETQELRPLAALERHRDALYPLIRELGFLDINKPLRVEHSHLLILGGSLDACYSRTAAAAAWATPAIRFIDGLSCYRPVHPAERGASAFSPACDTEFGVLSAAMTSIFRLTEPEDDFHGDRNLNRISCIRRFHGGDSSRSCRVFAAPSTQPEQRRADTGDSFLFYLRHTELQASDSILAVTNNRYCNRQFLQLVYHLLREECPAKLDVIGCTPDAAVVSPARYDPLQFLQDLAGILDWIDRLEPLLRE